MLPTTPPKLGRYEIVDEIGKGAMGVVYLARDPLIGRLVALKTFRIGYSVKDQELEQFRIRFMREAQSAGILSHPNVVTIHDVVEKTDEGIAFIAMEYVRGTNLKALLQSDQPLPLSSMADIVAQVAEALDYAHAHRVIHRDVKPANILITVDNRVKITDFGIARLDTSNLTQEGQLLGTPNYMAPEQIQGKEVDYRADLFALGVVLYEMLTRHKPFQGENLTVVSHRIVYDHFTPPREYAADLPPGLEPILDRALEKDPARRYQRARDMAEDLRRILTDGARDDLNETLSIASWAPPPPSAPTLPPEGDATAAIPPEPEEAPAQKPVKPRPPISWRRVALAGGLPALVLALVFGAAWLRGHKPADAAGDARARFVNLFREGISHDYANEFPQAIAAFEEALTLAPDDAERAKVEVRLRATRGRAALYQTTSGGDPGDTYVVGARAALADQRWEDAVTAAESALALDAGNVEARQVRDQAREGLARLQRRQRNNPGKAPAPGEQAAAVPAPAEPGPPPEETPAANDPASLRIVVRSEGPEVSVRITLKGKLLFNETLKDERAGFFHKARPFNAGGNRSVPAGVNELQILVAPQGMAGRTLLRSGNFPGGGTRTLEIHVSAAGEVTVNLI